MLPVAGARNAFGLARRLAAIAAIGVVGATLVPPLSSWAQASLAGHMVQHLLDTDVVPPLAFLAMPAWTRAFRFIRAPLALIASIALIWAIHFGPVFEVSLEQPLVGLLVHALFIFAGALMWAPIFDAGRLSYIARLGYVFLAMPMTGFLGFVLYSARSPLYAHYVQMCGAGALADQQSGGELMWVGGSAIMFAAFMILAAEFARYEARVSDDPA